MRTLARRTRIAFGPCPGSTASTFARDSVHTAVGTANIFRARTIARVMWVGFLKTRTTARRARIAMLPRPRFFARAG